MQHSSLQNKSELAKEGERASRNHIRLQAGTAPSKSINLVAKQKRAEKQNNYMESEKRIEILDDGTSQDVQSNSELNQSSCKRKTRLKVVSQQDTNRHNFQVSALLPMQPGELRCASQAANVEEQAYFGPNL